MPAALKSCPFCRALLDPNETKCPYCDQDLEAPRARRVDLESSGNPALVTGIIVGTCVLFFLFELIATLGTLGSSGLWAGLMSVPADVMIQMGARYDPLVEAGEWWRLFVPVFLHGSLLHLLFNGMALVQVGPLAEQAYGRSRFLVIYLASGVAGNLLGLQVYDINVGIGASGALFGLIGAAGLYGHRRGDTYGLMIRSIMVRWGLYALVFGLLMRADNAAHLGGLAAGLVLSFMLGHNERVRDRFGRTWTVFAAVLVALTLFSFAMAIYGYTEFGRGARGAAISVEETVLS
jgi:rhomboid protease GluP